MDERIGVISDNPCCPVESPRPAIQLIEQYGAEHDTTIRLLNLLAESLAPVLVSAPEKDKSACEEVGEESEVCIQIRACLRKRVWVNEALRELIEKVYV